MRIDLLIELCVVLIGLVAFAAGIWMRRRKNVIARTLGLIAAVLGALAAIGGLVGAAPMVVSELSEGSKAKIPPMSDRQQELIREVLQGEEVTRAMHEEFWKPLRGAGLSNDQLLAVRDQLTQGDSAVLAQRYQHELWKSARLSYQASRIVRTEALKSTQQSLLRSIRSSKEGTREFYKAIDNSLWLLNAAAMHGNFAVPERGEVLITIEFIDSVESRIDDTFARLDRLFNPLLLEHK